MDQARHNQEMSNRWRGLGATDKATDSSQTSSRAAMSRWPVLRELSVLGMT